MPSGHTLAMRVEPLGDGAVLLRDLGAPAFQVAKWLNAHPPAGLIEAVASYDTVGLYATPDLSLDLEVPESYEEEPVKHHSIPVCYEMGEDLEETAKLLGMTPDQLV